MIENPVYPEILSKQKIKAILESYESWFRQIQFSKILTPVSQAEP